MVERDEERVAEVVVRSLSVVSVVDMVRVV